MSVADGGRVAPGTRCWLPPRVRTATPGARRELHGRLAERGRTDRRPGSGTRALALEAPDEDLAERLSAAARRRATGAPSRRLSSSPSSP